MWEVSGGVSDESAKTSLKRGASTSRLAVSEMAAGWQQRSVQQRWREIQTTAGDKGSNARSVLGRGGTARRRPREQPEEVSSFGTTATTDFKTEDNTISMHRDRNALHVTCSVAPLALKPLSPCALPGTLW